MLGPVTREALAHIVHHMRDEDALEIFALRWDDGGTYDKARFIDEMVQITNAAIAKIAYARDGEPVALIGALPVWPGVWSVFAFGTGRWREVALTLTRYVLRSLVPVLRDDMGAHLAFCHARVEHTQARAWLERLGLKCEHVIREFGRDRSDYAFHARRA